MVNKWRGEVPFAPLGKGVFISFPLEDLAELEEQFGEDFFGAIENGVGRASPKVLPACLAIGLKRRDAAGEVELIWDTVGRDALQAEKFKLADTGKPILDAVSISWLQKSYDELVAEAEEARKKHDADKLKRAKEAAEEAGIPFDEALLEGLSKLLTGSGSTPYLSGD